MKHFKNILLIYPCDRTTLRRAATLASENRAKLTVIRVARELAEVAPFGSLECSGLDLRALVAKEYLAELDDFVAIVKKDENRLSTKVLSGTLFLEIIRDVIAHKRDLVMMTAEGKGGLKERLFGNTSLHLMRKCPCPVWVMKPTRRKRFLRIMAAVDPDPIDKIRDALNSRIMQLAASLAEQDNAELHVAHAWTAYGETLLAGRAGVSEAKVRQYVQQEEDKHREKMDALISAYATKTTRVHIIKGDPATVIPSIAKIKKVELLVMGTVCRIGIPGFFIGNTAEKILNEVDCSVLTIKPREFVSPVQLP